MDNNEKRSRRKAGKPFLAGDTPMQHSAIISCPYCGENFSLIVDGSAGAQRYFEDCEVCCKPIVIQVVTDWDGNLLAVDTAREDD